MEDRSAELPGERADEAGSTDRQDSLFERFKGSPIAIGALALVVAGGLGFAGYSIGASTGPDLEAYEQAGARAGTKVGKIRGFEKGYERGLKQGRKKGFASTYSRSYKKSYADAYEAEGLDRPSPDEIEVEK